MELTQDNYYSTDADMEYMSCSQYQAFSECEAKKLAELQGRWVSEPSEAFLVGNYFHSYFESPEAHEKFLEDNFDNIFKTKTVTDKATKEKSEVITGKYAPFGKADKMIETLENDPLMQQFLQMQGENEIFMTGEIFGTKWRMKMDKYVPDLRFIIDYKTVANIWETSYNPIKKERQTFVETYGYMFRAAIYSLIECQDALKISFDEAYKMLENDELNLPNFFLLCVSKQDYPDKEIIRLNNRQEYIFQLEQIIKKSVQIQPN